MDPEQIKGSSKQEPLNVYIMSSQSAHSRGQALLILCTLCYIR